MNIQTSGEFPTKPAQYIDRGAEMVSRLSGIVAFGMAIATLFYLAAF